MTFKKNTLILIAVLTVFLIVGILCVMLSVAEDNPNSRRRNTIQEMQENAARFVAENKETEPAVTSAADITAETAAVTAAVQKGNGYDAGYQAGYAAGVQDGNVQLSSVQAAEQAAYERGYTDGKAAAGNADSDGQTTQEAAQITVTVGGTFTAVVRAVLPDYQTDDTTLQAAVVQLHNDELFVMKVAPEVCKLLTANETYTFLVDEQTITVPNREFLLKDNVLSAEILKQQYIAVGSVRAPRKDESGANGTRLTYKETDNKGEIT